MRRIREVLRLKHELDRNHRQISAATGLSKGSVSEYLRRAKEAGITWEVARGLSDGELEGRLFKTPGRNLPVDRVPVDCEWVHREMRRKTVTLQLLWVEYRDAARHDAASRRPYQYSQFCERYKQFRRRVDASMRQQHRGGEKAFVDYSGVKPSIVDRETGEVIEVELYVAVLGASSFTFAEATRTQKRDEFIASTARAFEYFGGVPEITVPDQLRSAVSGPDRLDPEINPVFAEFGEHYGTAVIPARPRKPKDKAKVEVGVQVAQRWILAQLRNVTFFSLEDLNAAIAELLEELNERPFRKLEGCRRSAYEKLDKPALQPLPARRFEPSTWKKAKVHIDYHAEFDARYYSASHHLIGSEVWVRATVELGRIAARWPPDRQPQTQLRSQGNLRHRANASSEVAPAVGRLAAAARDRMGRRTRSEHGSRRRADHRQQAAPRAGLPLLPRADPRREALLPGAGGGRVPTSAPDRRADPAKRRRDPSQRTRPGRRRRRP